MTKSWWKCSEFRWAPETGTRSQWNGLTPSSPPLGTLWQPSTEWSSAPSKIKITSTTASNISYPRDKDQDTYYPGNSNPQYNCAQKRKGGGWFSNCGHAHLTGLLTSASRRLPDEMQIHWYYAGSRGNSWNSMKEVEIKLVGERWARNRGDDKL